MFREIRKKRNKVDALRVCDKVCFTVYGNETIREEVYAEYGCVREMSFDGKWQ